MMAILKKHFGPFTLPHIIKDERIREYRSLEDTINACQEIWLANPLEERTWTLLQNTFRDYEN